MDATVRANGIDIHYRIDGPDDAPLVTLSHSLCANLAMWDSQVETLSTRFKVLRYDTRGHGSSEAPPGPYSLPMLADDVAALLEALGEQKTHFVGLSMGGMIGQQLALEHASLIDHLVLCDTASGRGGQDQAAWRSTWEARIEIARVQGLAAGADGIIDRWFSPGFVAKEASTVGAVRTMICETPLEGFCGCCHALAGLDFTERLPAIEAPTLIIVGEDDPGTPVAASQLMHEKISGSELVVLPGARHLSNIEAADGFNAALQAFLP